MAHKKGQGATRNGRDSKPKYRGVKKYGGQVVRAGNILWDRNGLSWPDWKAAGDYKRIGHGRCGSE